jgi:DNA polymerase elongation subunit (family B)
MMEFYTNVARHGNKILLRGYRHGKQFSEKIKYKPFLFMKGGKDSKYKDVYGNNVIRHDFDSMSDAREFLDNHSKIKNVTLYGMTNYVYPFLNDNYKNLNYDLKLLRITFIDIETAKDEQGFSSVEEARCPVTAITVRCGEKIIAFGCGDYKPKESNVRYVKCRDELDLLLKFLDTWEYLSPDVVSGWNSQGYDIPYLINRIRRILSTEKEDFALRLSPWRKIERREFTLFNKTQVTYNLVGIACLDYMDLYKKFSPNKPDSYTLNFIAYLELGEKKIDYSEYASLQDLHDNDYEKFFDYNIKDTNLVYRLEQKLKFVELAASIAYMAKANYADALKTVPIWDALIHNRLLRSNIVVPFNKSGDDSDAIPGGYNKDARPGRYAYVVSVDATSMYPHLIMQFNISPETIGKSIWKHIDFDQEVALGCVPKPADGHCISGAGHTFRTDRTGFLSELQAELFVERKEVKDRMLDLSREIEKTNDPALKDEKDRLNNKQNALKIVLNAGYGALLNRYFRWYDPRLGESVTVSGQITIQWAIKSINDYMNKLLKTNEDYVLASDTDSVYICFEELVKKYQPDDPIKFIDAICEEKLQPYLCRQFEQLAGMMGCPVNKIIMKREAITTCGVWTGKKRYFLNIVNNEGVQYDEPKLKITGLEPVRSAVPEICRNALKDAFKIIINGSEDELIEYVDKFRETYYSEPFDVIAFPRGVHTLDKEYDLGVPIHVRASRVYNQVLADMKLDRQFQKINQGDKLKFCYLRMPNPSKNNVIGAPGFLPKQMGLDKYIDYNLMFDKTFLEPLRAVTDVIGWKPERVANLEGLWA